MLLLSKYCISLRSFMKFCNVIIVILNNDNKIYDMKNIPHLVCTAVLYILTKDINYILNFNKIY